MTHHSHPDQWLAPRPFSDPSMRRQKYGRILPMEQPQSNRRFLIVAGAQGLLIMIGFFAVMFLTAALLP